MKNFIFCSVLRQELVKLDKVMLIGQNLFNNTFFTEHLQMDTRHTTLAESAKKVFYKILQNAQKNTCARISFLIKPGACNFIKIEALAQLFLC